MMSWYIRTTALVGLYALASIHIIQAQDTCDWNGQVFQKGQSLGDAFATRCGSALDFPCYCNPELDPPIECPYCGYAQENGNLLCAGDLEIVSFADLEGNDKTCECAAPRGGGDPTPNCDISSENSGGTCTIDLPDGNSRTFAPGESLGDFLPNRCGSDFPCYCNPRVPGQIECPYCRFAAMGGGLVCARDAETVTYQDMDGEFQMCSCEIQNREPLTRCDASAPPAEGPAQAPVQAPSRPLTPTDQIDVCSLELESGQIVTFQNGESYGDYLTNRCGTTDEFPCYCNPNLPNKVECPYCGFVSGDGGLFCAQDKETISFSDGSVMRTCSCEIPDDPSEEPIRSCAVGDLPPTSAPILPPPTSGCTVSQANGEQVTIEEGESFGILVEGVCGAAKEWPSFCNSAASISRQIADNVEYPYCIFENTESGDPVCSRNNEQARFVDDNGVEQVCGCLYLSDALGGAQSTCRPANDAATSAPTATPPEVTSSASMVSTAILGAAGISLMIVWNAML